MLSNPVKPVTAWVRAGIHGELADAKRNGMNGKKHAFEERHGVRMSDFLKRANLWSRVDRGIGKRKSQLSTSSSSLF